MVVRVVIGVGAAMLIAWLAMLVILLLHRPEEGAAREALRVLPDTVRLLRRLAADRSLPRGVRVRLWLLLGYLLFPIDLVPDFVPVIGYADDVIVVGVALRSVLRHTGADAIRRHWPGTQDGLAALWRAARLPEEPQDPSAGRRG